MCNFVGGGRLLEQILYITFKFKTNKEILSTTFYNYNFRSSTATRTRC